MRDGTEAGKASGGGKRAGGAETAIDRSEGGGEGGVGNGAKQQPQQQEEAEAEAEATKPKQAQKKKESTSRKRKARSFHNFTSDKSKMRGTGTRHTRLVLDHAKSNIRDDLKPIPNEPVGVGKEEGEGGAAPVDHREAGAWASTKDGDCLVISFSARECYEFA